MELFVQIVFAAFGGCLFILLIVMPLLGIALAFLSYFQYHFFGKRSPMIDDLFYRSSRGETTPPPNKVKALMVIIVPALIVAYALR